MGFGRFEISMEALTRALGLPESAKIEMIRQHTDFDVCPRDAESDLVVVVYVSDPSLRPVRNREIIPLLIPYWETTGELCRCRRFKGSNWTPNDSCGLARQGKEGGE